MDRDVEDVIHGMDPEKVFAIGQRSGARIAINRLVDVATTRVHQLLRDAHEADKVVCIAQGIFSDIIRELADIAPDRLPLPLPSSRRRP